MLPSRSASWRAGRSPEQRRRVPAAPGTSPQAAGSCPWLPSGSSRAHIASLTHRIVHQIKTVISPCWGGRHTAASTHDVWAPRTALPPARAPGSRPEPTAALPWRCRPFPCMPGSPCKPFRHRAAQSTRWRRLCLSEERQLWASHSGKGEPQDPRRDHKTFGFLRRPRTLAQGGQRRREAAPILPCWKPRTRGQPSGSFVCPHPGPRPCPALSPNCLLQCFLFSRFCVLSSKIIPSSLFSSCCPFSVMRLEHPVG